MGNLKAIFATGTTLATAALTIVACGSDSAKTPDAPVKVIDAAPDSPAQQMDAAVDAAPSYDFTCFGSAQGSSAPATITVSGTTYTITQQGSAAVPGVTVDAYKTGVVAPLASGTSDGSGNYSLTVATGTMPVDGYVKGSKSGDRTTYMYPPNPLVADLAMAPVLMISDSTFNLLLTALLMTTQDDANNGVVIAAAVDCQNKPITGATLTVQQGGSDVGSAQDLSQYGFPGTLVLNVPDGNTDVGASYGSMTFPSHVVVAHKKGNGSGAEGSLTITVVRPGP